LVFLGSEAVELEHVAQIAAVQRGAGGLDAGDLRCRAVEFGRDLVRGEAGGGAVPAQEPADAAAAQHRALAF
jgi:hypothetical protein